MIDITDLQEKIANWLKSIGISAPAPIVEMGLVLALIILLFFILTLRRLHLFNVQVHTLKNIDLRLKGIEEGFSMFTSEESNTIDEKTKEQQEHHSPAEVAEIDRQDRGLKGGSQCNVGKSGRIYTVEELELQIRE